MEGIKVGLGWKSPILAKNLETEMANLAPYSSRGEREGQASAASGCYWAPDSDCDEYRSVDIPRYSPYSFQAPSRVSKFKVEQAH